MTPPEAVFGDCVIHILIIIIMKNINITVHHRMSQHKGFEYLENPRRRVRTFTHRHFGWKIKVRSNGVTVSKFVHEDGEWKRQDSKRMSLSEGRDFYSRVAYPGSNARSVKVWHDDKLMFRKLAKGYVPQSM